MKNMRKLIPAIAMLLVSAVMMSTASFAWFSQAQTATAEGMQVKAVASGGLVIGSFTAIDVAPLDSASGFKSVASAVYKNHAATTASLAPSSANTTGQFFTASSEEASDSEAKAGSYAAVDAAVANNTAFLYTKWLVKGLAENTGKKLTVANIVLDYTNSTTTEMLNKSIRVALKVTNTSAVSDAGVVTTTGDARWYFFAPEGDETSYKYVSSVASGTGTVTNRTVFNGTSSTAASVLPTQIVTGEDAKDIVISDTIGLDAVLVEVYIYYEGEDTHCVSAYALASNVDTSVTINFGTK